MAFKPLSCIYGNCVIPQRYICWVVLMFTALNLYHLRVVLNVAIVVMEAKSVNDTNIVDACPMYKLDEPELIKGGTFHFSNEAQNLLLYTFYFGYIVGHIPGGFLADKFGARYILGGSLVLGIIIDLLFPTAIQYGGECWALPTERAFMAGFVLGGNNLGTVTGMSLTGLIIKKTHDWTLPFYVWGFCAIVCSIFYSFTVFSRPATHPFITPEERTKIEAELGTKKKFKVPWAKMAKCCPLYAILAAQLGHNYQFFIVFTDLPKYVHEILKLDIQSNGAFSAGTFLAYWFGSVFFGFIADVITNRGWLTTLNTRRIFQAASCLVPATCLLAAVYAGCNRTMVTILYTIALFFMGLFVAGVKVNVVDLTINYSGIATAFINGIGAISGILGPFTVQAFTGNHSIEGWQTVMWILMVISICTTLIFAIFTTADRQEWDYPEAEG